MEIFYKEKCVPLRKKAICFEEEGCLCRKAFKWGKPGGDFRNVSDDLYRDLLKYSWSNKNKEDD